MPRQPKTPQELHSFPRINFEDDEVEST